MKFKLYLALLFCGIVDMASAQSKFTSSGVGAAAPPLRVGQWIKGKRIQNFKKGHVYIIEFWATWCKPCMVAMPHLSATAKKYKQQASVIAIDVLEEKTTALQQIKAIVAAKKDIMGFAVVTEDTRFTQHDWLDSFDEKKNGIPRTFIVDAGGKVAWIGLPFDLDEVLPQIINNTWDINKEIKKKIADNYLDALDDQIPDKINKLAKWHIVTTKTTNIPVREKAKPDSVLMVINAMVKKEPKLRFAQYATSYTFAALLETDPKKAHDFGRQALQTTSYDELIGDIKDYNGKAKLPPYIYQLGAEAYQQLVNQWHAYPGLIDEPLHYHKMAAWYKLAGNNTKAVWAESKAASLSLKK